MGLGVIPNLPKAAIGTKQGEVTQTISYAPVYHITGDSPQAIAQAVEEQSRELVPQIMREATEYHERTAYGAR